MELSPQEFKRTKQNKTTQKKKEKKERIKSQTSKPRIPSSEYTHFKTIPAGQWVWGPHSTTTLKDLTSFSKGYRIMTSSDPRSPPKAWRWLDQSVVSGQKQTHQDLVLIIFPKTPKKTFPNIYEVDNGLEISNLWFKKKINPNKKALSLASQSAVCLYFFADLFF